MTVDFGDQERHPIQERIILPHHVVTDSWQACHKFNPSKGEMHVKSQTSSVGGVSERKEVKCRPRHLTYGSSPEALE
ncbi:hypothetical protein TNCV_2533511 [Trichonephila clavipes]|nr:hypothetical protein TNCV_2533511 [Trichonephila clavipes]